MKLDPRLAALVTGTTGGILMMLLAQLTFAGNDTIAKWLLGSFEIGQILVLRSVAALLVLSPFLVRLGSRNVRRMPRPRLQWLRVLLSTVEVALFFRALFDLPLADTIAIYMAAPIYVTAVSPFLLGERVGWRRWSAVGVGFCGVLLALGPGLAEPSIGLASAVLGSISYALYLVTTRMLAGTHVTVLAANQFLGALLLGVLLVAIQGWTHTDVIDALLLASLGLGSVAGNLCVNQSLRLAQASVVVPYQYTLIVWGVILGAVVFGEIMDTRMVAGTVIIIGAGLFIFLREQHLKRQAAAASSGDGEG